jgi:hypothetical protein
MTTAGEVVVIGSKQSSALQSLLMADDIVPGAPPSYQLCKTIYSYHTLGKKLVDTPITMAQSQDREISVKVPGLENILSEAFMAQWEAMQCNKHIANMARLSRIYGIASLALLTEGKTSSDPIDYSTLYEQEIVFNTLDPLNTAGSLVLSQDPNSFDFQKVNQIYVNNQTYHRSRTITLLNEEPLYIEYTTSAFGFVGRSIFQRSLYPLKSFIQSMITDDMVSLKAGVLIAKMKGSGSIVDRARAAIAGIKRQFLKEAVATNVLSIDVDEVIESLNFQNLEGPFTAARKNIIENIASAIDMPAKLLNSETFAEGFGEGTEDAKHVAQYIAGIREWLNPAYEWMDRIVQHRAWTPDFFKTIQKRFPDEYGKADYGESFFKWRNAFKTLWPNLLEESDSEKATVADVKLKAIIAIIEVFNPIMPQEEKAKVIQWAQDNVNAIDFLFETPLMLDIEAIAEYEPPENAFGEDKEPSEPRPFAEQDSTIRLPLSNRRLLSKA